ncbi:AMP-binding enzyme [Rhodococcus sp. RDE2]|uniref:AMP-binding enzyme n=1 Tax=Rhodococcus sp. RDE2 TaxID=2885078 RepID=UPI002B4BAC9C|nr:hypothetical protein [Rhodococcus sp. RDE2]
MSEGEPAPRLNFGALVGGSFLGYLRKDGTLTPPVLTPAGMQWTGDYATGSLADGTLRLLGRGDDVFRSNGHLVAPAELEGLFQRHPAVRSAAVVPAETTDRGLVPVAFVVADHGYEAFDEIPATAAAVAETTAPADGQLPAATAESHHLSATTDDVTSLLPTTLLTSSSSCDKSGFSSEGALQLQCNLNADSALGKTIGMERYEYVSVTAWRDDQYARPNFIRLRDTTDGTTTTISDDSTRLVNYDDSVNTSVHYTVIDRSTGLNATFRMNSVAAGTTFLTELGWTS